MNHTMMVLAALGILTGGTDADSIRQDAGYTATLSRALESMKKTIYEIKYPDLVGRQMVPISHEADPAAESIKYQEWDYQAMAKLLANGAIDIPLVGVTVEEFLSPVHSLADAYQWSVMDLRRAAMANVPLSSRLAAAGRMGIERKIDDLIAVGDPQAKLKGLVNHPNVTILTAVDPGNGQTWTGHGGVQKKTDEEILNDVNTAVGAIIAAAKGAVSPDTVALPVAEYAEIAMRKLTSNPSTTVLKWILETSPYIKAIVPYFKLETANAAGTGPRMLVYKRDPSVMTFEIPQEFEQLPPQAEGMFYKVICHARAGGLILYQPFAVTYMDGI